MFKSIISSILIAIMLSQPSTAMFKTQNFSVSQSEDVKFTEKVSAEEIVANEKVVAAIQFDYEANDISALKAAATDDLTTNQELVRKIRQSNKTYYSSQNAKFIEKAEISYANMKISSYSPFVFIEFDSYTEYQAEKDELIAVAEKQQLGSVNVSTVATAGYRNLDADVAPEDITPPVIYMEDAKEMIGTSNSSYTGNGIYVGFAEYGYPDNLNIFEDTSIVTYSSIGNDVNSHATKTASIVGGEDGIAPGIELFFANNIESVGIEWLVEQGCLIINVSAGIFSDNSEDNGYYWLYDAYIDYLAWSNLVCFVVAAGNESTWSDFYISHPATAQNAITVGNIDANQYISARSCYDLAESMDNYLAKPTVVAPGQNIYVSGANNSEDFSFGTSFSAPMVTGMIALLMEEFSELIMYPEIIISATISGANTLPTQTDSWDVRAGAGLINYVNTRQILSFSNYNSATVANPTTASILMTDTVIVPSGNTLRYSFYGIYNSGETFSGNTTTHYIPNVSRYVVTIYDSEGFVVKSTVCTKNAITNSFVNTSDEEQQYTIKVRLFANKQITTNDYISISYRTYF